MSLEKVVSRAEIGNISLELKQQGKTVVFTNGCFDILHIGHARYLQAARDLGDVLIVGLNSDTSVKALKGQDRPINSEEDRAELLSHLQSVGYVVIFDELRPDDLIRIVKPDIHSKGGDYKLEELPERFAVEENGGKVAILPLVPGKSTTATLEKLNKK